MPTPTTDQTPTLDELIDALEREFMTEAAAERDLARKMGQQGEQDRFVMGRASADTLIRCSRRLREALVRVEPRFRGGDGYSESWEVTCPGGCGAILDYQRFLFANGEPGRWTNDDSVMSECTRCGHDLEDVHPCNPTLDDLVRARNAARAANA